MSNPARRTLDNARSTGSAVRLTVVEGPAIGQEFKVDGTATIGRSPDASVMVDDPGVSRLHARIRRSESGGFEVEDLGSKNGTFLNGARVEHALAGLGDKIRVGPRVVLSLSTFDVVEDQLVQRQRLETVGRLGAGIAHDLNNVLAAVHAGTAFLQQLSSGTPLGDPRVKECLRDLTLATAQGAELTRGILRVVRGKRSVREPVDLGELVVEVARILRHTIDHSILVETRVQPEVVVHGNHSELQQILLNLCLNARDAMAQGGALRVVVGLAMPPAELGLVTDRPYALLEVSDTGTGIDEETRTRIFEPFFTTKPPGSGTGLGMAITYGIVQGHHGDIAVQSAPGKGTRFTIRLPLLRADLAAPAISDPGDGNLVLVVDDDEVVRRATTATLWQLGYSVAASPGGAVAVELVRARPERFSAVLLDLVMPGMTGSETFHELAGIRPDIPVIVCTGFAADKHIDADVKRRIAGLVRKPFTAEQLGAALQGAGVEPGRRPAGAGK
jgi:signal transduction histidine kinase/CheY-like chemotaxis protein